MDIRRIVVALLTVAVTFACAAATPQPRGGPPTGSDDERAALAVF